ncbi:MAG TPA: DUF917 domain-containing protein [Nitrososphaerales archaeon]|nr:DUF917 domain-containing protein [Nitrososphaerales archaeon]
MRPLRRWLNTARGPSLADLRSSDDEMRETLILSSDKEVRDFVRGCTFYGTGGGGSPDYGYGILTRVLKEKKRIPVFDPESIADDDWTVCAYGMGSIAPRTPEILEEMKRLSLTRVKVTYKLAEAIKELERFAKVRVDVIVPLEIGGANTPDPVATAAHMGIKVVDGDYSGGRAIPEIVQTAPHIAGKRMNPLSSVDEWGDRVMLEDSVNNLVAEKIGKLVSILAFGNLAGNATYLLRGREMKKLVTSGTVLRAATAGRAIREAREEGKEIAREVVKASGGYLLFEGTITKKEERDQDGYYWGSNELKGTGEFSSHSFKYWFKNENHLTWMDSKLHVTSPDIICVIDSRTGEPITNPASKVGDRVSLIGYRSADRFRSPRALGVLGPRHFGVEAEYVPIEKVVH